METKDWIVIAAVALGAIFNATALNYRDWRERRSNLREALFCLLEMRRMLLTYDTKKIASILVEAVKSRSGKISPSDEKFIADMYNSMLQRQADDIHRLLSSERLSQFQESMRKISRTMPVLTFELNTYEIFMHIRLITTSSLDHVRSLLPTDEILETVNKYVAMAESNNYKRYLEDISEDILAVATKCGPEDYEACVEILDRDPSQAIRDRIEEQFQYFSNEL